MRAIFLFFSFLPGCVMSQETHDDVTPEYEEILSLNESNTEDGAAYENLLQFASHPMDLNAATEEDLKLLLLSPIQTRQIISHRNENGKFISVYELQSVDGLDIETIRRIAPFIKVRSPSQSIDGNLFRRIRREGESYVLLMTAYPIEQKRGFQTNTEPGQRFEGSRERVLMRYRTFRAGDYSFGITAEKDEGERFRWSAKKHQLVFDHLSFHALLTNKGNIRNIVVGDFQCQFGQGLVWGGAIGFGKGSETITTVRRANVGIVPYTSAYEAGYLRGAAATVRVSDEILLTGILSSALRDGNIQQENDDPVLGSLLMTGVHRNEKELLSRKTIRETISGGAIQFRKRNLEAGLTLQNVTYSLRKTVEPRPYNQFAFEGTSNLNAGAFLNYNYQNISFFSEFAKSIGHGNGYLAGALFSLTKKFDLSILHRHYARDFYSFYGNGFSENSVSQNEQGIYWGWKYRLSRKYSFSGYMDFFRFPWLKFRTYAPSDGTEILIRWTWQPNRSTLFFLQGRHELKSRNTSDERPEYRVTRIAKMSWWLNLEYAVSPQLKMRTRIQTSGFAVEKRTTSGFLLYHDAVLNVGRLKATARYSVFDTDDYDNRLYAFENEIWMAYSLPAYYGKGIRRYIMLQYKLNKALTFWLRYAQTRYLNVDTIGSGLDGIDGNTRNEIKFETRLRF